MDERPAYEFDLPDLQQLRHKKVMITLKMTGRRRRKMIPSCADAGQGSHAMA